MKHPKQRIYQDQLKILNKINMQLEDQDTLKEEELGSSENFLSCKIISLVFGKKIAKKWNNL